MSPRAASEAPAVRCIAAIAPASTMRVLRAFSVLAVFVTLPACDLFGGDEGAFELALSGGLSGTYSGTADYDGAFDADGGRIRLRVNDYRDPALGTRVTVQWTGSGPPPVGTHPVFDRRRPAGERPAGVFLVEVILESRDRPDVFLDATGGSVEVHASGAELRGSAAFDVVGSSGGPVSAAADLTFRAVRR